jgi:hypothetical protein
MTLSRTLDVFMTLLSLSLFLLFEAGRIEPTGPGSGFFVVIWPSFGFNKHRFSASHGGVLCGYLLWRCIVQRLVTVGCRPNPLIIIGGESNDFY